MGNEAEPAGAPDTDQSAVAPDTDQSAGAPDARESATLTGRDTAILEFEHEWWRHGGAKEEAIRRDFGVSPARYYQLLNALIDSPAAIAHDPMLVRRLQRIRETRTTDRAAQAGYLSPSGRLAVGTTRTED